MIPSGPPIQQIKDSMRVTWMAGNFGIVAKTIFAGCRGLGQLPRHPVLRAHADVAYGTGNVAIALARHQGAPSLPVDIAPKSPRQARERAAAEDLTATFDEGDAERPLARLFVAALTFSFCPQRWLTAINC